MSDFLIEPTGGVLRVTINHPERGRSASAAADMAVPRAVDTRSAAMAF